MFISLAMLISGSSSGEKVYQSRKGNDFQETVRKVLFERDINVRNKSPTCLIGFSEAEGLNLKNLSLFSHSRWGTCFAHLHA